MGDATAMSDKTKFQLAGDDTTVTQPHASTAIARDCTSRDLSHIIKFRDLEPSWHVASARVPGFMRWLISWVGGPKGYVNPSFGRSVQGENIGVGYMYLPIGQRQEGLHYHTVTEIYVILKGQVQSYESDGSSSLGGPMDCIYIPKGVPHGVRNCGLEDVELIWVHDDIEAKGLTVYCNTEAELDAAPSKEPIRTVKMMDLEPCWSAPEARTPEFLRYSINWVGGEQRMINLNPRVAIPSPKVVLGLTTILPGNKHLLHKHSQAEVYIIVRGRGVVDVGQGLREVSYLDGVYFPAHTYHHLRNHTREPLEILWVLERPERCEDCKYQIDRRAPACIGAHI